MSREMSRESSRRDLSGAGIETCLLCGSDPQPPPRPRHRGRHRARAHAPRQRLVELHDLRHLVAHHLQVRALEIDEDLPLQLELQALLVLRLGREMGVGNGYNAATEDYGDLVEMGVIDPTKVVHTALGNAASIAALLLTTEAIVADEEEEEEAGAGGHGHAH